MKGMFLDESGDHKLKRINPKYPVFVLGGVIVDRTYARAIVEPAFRQFKIAHFGREDVILHTVEMNKGRGDYQFLADPVLRKAFYSDLNDMLGDLDYEVVACVIRKPEHVAKSKPDAIDPYMYSLDILVERFCEALGDDMDNGFICAEQRNPGLDRALIAAWEELTNGGSGTGNLSSQEIDARVVGFSLKDKKPNIAGMQLADLVITPIGRYVVGTAPRQNEVRWSVVESKVRRVGGQYLGNGLIIRPDRT